MIRIRALIFDGKLRYDANEREALQEEKARSRLSSKLHFLCAHLSRRVGKHGNTFDAIPVLETIVLEKKKKARNK